MVGPPSGSALRARGLVGRPQRGGDRRPDRHRPADTAPASARGAAQARARVSRRGAVALPDGAARGHDGRSRGTLERRKGGADADTPVEAAERLLGFVAALSTHDHVTRGHSERVRAYSQMIAKELHLGRDEVDRLNWAALLHDIGKLEVPAEVLNKPGRPTDGGVGADPTSPRARRAAGRAAARLAGRVDERHRRSPRALGRGRLPEGHRGRRDLAGRPHRGRRRRLRRHHLRALLQGVGQRDHGARGDRALRGRPVRPARRARVPEHLARPAAARDGAAVVARAGTRARANPARAGHGDSGELCRGHGRRARGRARGRIARADAVRDSRGGGGPRACSGGRRQAREVRLPGRRGGRPHSRSAHARRRPERWRRGPCRRSRRRQAGRRATRPAAPAPAARRRLLPPPAAASSSRPPRRRATAPTRRREDAGPQRVRLGRRDPRPRRDVLGLADNDALFRAGPSPRWMPTERSPTRPPPTRAARRDVTIRAVADDGTRSRRATLTITRRAGQRRALVQRRRRPGRASRTRARRASPPGPTPSRPDRATRPAQAVSFTVSSDNPRSSPRAASPQSRPTARSPTRPRPTLGRRERERPRRGRRRYGRRRIRHERGADLPDHRGPRQRRPGLHAAVPIRPCSRMPRRRPSPPGPRRSRRARQAKAGRRSPSPSPAATRRCSRPAASRPSPATGRSPSRPRPARTASRP